MFTTWKYSLPKNLSRSSGVVMETIMKKIMMIKTVEQCIGDYYDLNMNCTLPWSQSNILLPYCSDSEKDHDKWRNLHSRLGDASGSTFWKMVDCQPKCQYTKYTLKPITQSNFDRLKFHNQSSDGANIDVRNILPFFLLTKYIPVFADTICIHFNGN